MSIVEKLTEGIVRRDLAKEGAALLNKWERTGLLEGLDSDYAKNNMASLLENQAKELLREASLMSQGDVEGFAAVAFPIVRRVFGSLIANDLVSVQPMSLPSGLIFFLDFKFSSEGAVRAGFPEDESIYGQGRIGHELTAGVLQNSLTEDQQPYGLASGFAHATKLASGSAANLVQVCHGTASSGVSSVSNADIDKLIQYDMDIPSGTLVSVLRVTLANLDQVDDSEAGLRHITVGSGSTTANSDIGSLVIPEAFLSSSTDDQKQIRRLTRFSGSARTHALLFFTGSTPISGAAGSVQTSVNGVKIQYRQADDFGGTANAGAGAALGSVVAQDTWGLEANESMPEIEIQVDSISVTAQTKKLKAKWSPELGQDLNAYHNLDAEVELTSILSEQIALEIDREILADLIGGAKAATYYWSRSPGNFVDRETGATLLSSTSVAPDFTGNVSEWYETLIETINDVSAAIHRKTLRGGANFLVCGPEVANILEFTSGFRANVSHADEKGTVGAVNVGSISKKFDVMVDPYFPRNVILVGRKGNSFLESGYVYAPYVPLQVTPTIFGTEDFVPRKGVMTRYAKKMVRPDMYGLVICRGMLGEAV